MATELAEHQFELLPSVSAEEGFVFGIGTDVSIDQSGFDPGGLEWQTQDGVNPTRGTTLFGRDMLLGPNWIWEAFIDRTDTEEAIATLAIAKKAWKARHIRSTPGEILALRYKIAGRTRRIYGRPRRFVAPPDNLILAGYVPITADFKCVDDLHYEDTADSFTLSMESFANPGILFPVTFPIASAARGSNQDSATVGGDEPTYPVITFRGPITNPQLATDNWVLRVEETLLEGDEIVIDTRPWVLTAIKNGTTSVAGKLGRRQWLQDVILEPGIHEFDFSGNTSLGSASVEVTWNSAYSSL